MRWSAQGDSFEHLLDGARNGAHASGTRPCLNRHMHPVRRILRVLPPALFVAVLSLPLAQTVFGFAPSIGLAGAVDVGPERAPRTLAGWHSGVLQAELEHDLVQGLGLRDWMVRLDNQLKYWLFGITKGNVRRGSNDWLYEEGYLTALTHSSIDWAQVILDQARQLWQAQQVLKEHGVTLLLLVTPSKVETLPEHLPFPHRQVQAMGYLCHIDYLEAILSLGGLDHLDAQRLFWDWSRTEPQFPLYPRSGIHWSQLAAARITAMMVDQFEKLSGVDLVNLDIATHPGTGRASGEDDLLKLANLLDERGMRDPLPVPEVSARPGDRGERHGFLIVSSSFGWSLAEFLRDLVARPLSVFYYGKSRHDWIDGQQQPGRSIDFDAAAFRTDVLRYRFVVVECNASQVPGLGHGFPGAVLAAFGPPQAAAPPAFDPVRVKAVLDALGSRRPGR